MVILLKRGLSATITELLLSAEYVLAEGNSQVILCERGLRSFDPLTRTLFDLTEEAATVSGAIERRQFAGGREIGPVEHGLPEGWTLLSPIDLQCVKACGVTFAVSAIERVIEERARGDARRAAEIREALEAKVGAGIRAVVPGSAAVKDASGRFIHEPVWRYLFTQPVDKVGEAVPLDPECQVSGR